MSNNRFVKLCPIFSFLFWKFAKNKHIVSERVRTFVFYFSFVIFLFFSVFRSTFHSHPKTVSFYRKSISYLTIISKIRDTLYNQNEEEEQNRKLQNTLVCAANLKAKDICNLCQKEIYVISKIDFHLEKRKKKKNFSVHIFSALFCFCCWHSSAAAASHIARNILKLIKKY